MNCIAQRDFSVVDLVSSPPEPCLVPSVTVMSEFPVLCKTTMSPTDTSIAVPASSAFMLEFVLTPKLLLLLPMVLETREDPEVKDSGSRQGYLGPLARTSTHSTDGKTEAQRSLSLPRPSTEHGRDWLESRRF